MTPHMVIFLLAIFAVSNAAVVDTRPQETVINATARQVSQDACTFADLDALSSSPAAVRDRFGELYGKTPDGIAVNSEGYYGAVSPAITEQYGFACNKLVGEASFQSLGSDIDNVILLEKTVRNFGDTESTSNVALERTWVDSVEASISFTAGFSFSFTAGVQGVSSAGHEFSFSITSGQTEKSESRDRISSTDVITVPARSSVFVRSYAVIQRESLSYSMPMWVSGHFGANFPDRVRPADGSTDNEAYFWFQPVSTILPTTHGIASGIVTDAYSIDFRTEVGAASPLTAEELAAGPSAGDFS